MRAWLRRIRDRVGGGPALRRFAPDEPAFVADPYPTFAWLREHEPVHRSEGGAYVLTRHADVTAALADERLSNAPARHAVVHARNRDRYVAADVANHILPFLDPPAHSAPRRRIGRAFHQHLKDRAPDLDAIAEQTLDRVARSDGSLDVVADFGSPFAVRVIARMLGVPDAHTAALERCSESFFRLFAPLPSEQVRQRLDDDLAACRELLLPLLAERRRAPQPDVLSALATAGDELTDLQLVDNVMLLFADGVENVDRAIGSATDLLLRHERQLRRWQQAPSLLPSVVDECLRFESPAQFVARIAREPLELHGVAIAPGAVLVLALAAANRDPRAFDRPDEFDVGRHPNPHLSFGQGRHSCIGGPLVERELAAALRALFARFSRLQLAEPVRWLPRPAHRWPERVLVRVG